MVTGPVTALDQKKVTSGVAVALCHACPCLQTLQSLPLPKSHQKTEEKAKSFTGLKYGAVSGRSIR